MANKDDFQLDQFLPFRLNQVAEKFSLNFARIYRQRYAMTRPEWRTLANLGEFGRMTAKEVCVRSGQHKTKVSRAVASLEQRRWLLRHQNPDDRREEWLELTKDGLAAYRELALLGKKQDEILVETLGKTNFKALLKGLDALENL